MEEVDKVVIGVMSNDMDKVIPAFIIALGAKAYDMEVDMFFTFWGISVLRNPKKKVSGKDFISRMFGWMLPRGAGRLKLSKMNMAGMGPKLMGGLMQKQGVKSLEELIQDAGALGVKIHLCEMSMNLMGVSPEEIIEYPGMDICGVSTFIALSSEAKTTLFF